MLQYQLKKPDAVHFNKKNDILPFENITPIEGFANKYNASLFAFASHNKKRPNNIILGKEGHIQFYHLTLWLYFK